MDIDKIHIALSIKTQRPKYNCSGYKCPCIEIFYDENLKILEAGLAYYYPHKLNHKYSKILLKTQRRAMNEKRGIWKKLDQKGSPVIGNKKSKRFHLKNCRYGKGFRLQPCSYDKERLEWQTVEPFYPSKDRRPPGHVFHTGIIRLQDRKHILIFGK